MLGVREPCHVEIQVVMRRILISAAKLEVSDGGGIQRQARELASDLVRRKNLVFLYSVTSHSLEKVSGSEKDAESSGFELVQPGASRRCLTTFFSLLVGLSTRFILRAPTAYRAFLGRTLGSLMFFSLTRAIKSLHLGKKTELRLLSNPTTLFEVWGLIQVARASNAEVVVSLGTHANIPASVATAILQLKVVLCERVDSNQFLPRIADFEELYERASVVSVNLREAKDDLRLLLKGREVLWFPNSYSYVEKRLSNSTPKHALVVSRLVRKKGLPEVVAAFTEPFDCAPQFELHIYGSGSMRQSLQKQINSSSTTSRVKLKGFRRSESIDYGAYRFFIANGTGEGSSNSLHEAIIRGLIPLISTSVREFGWFIDDPILAKLLHDGSRQGIRDLVGSLLENPQIEEDARRHLAKRYQEFCKLSEVARKRFLAEISV